MKQMMEFSQIIKLGFVVKGRNVVAAARRESSDAVAAANLHLIPNTSSE